MTLAGLVAMAALITTGHITSAARRGRLWWVQHRPAPVHLPPAPGYLKHPPPPLPLHPAASSGPASWQLILITAAVLLAATAALAISRRTATRQPSTTTPA